MSNIAEQKVTLEYRGSEKYRELQSPENLFDVKFLHFVLISNHLNKKITCINTCVGND